MIRSQNPDGTWTERTDEEFIKEFGEEELQRIRAPLLKRSEMTEGQKYLADKMMMQAAAQSGIEIEIVDGRPVWPPGWDPD